MKILLILLTICLLPQQLQAKKLYKYKDKKGRWYYSDIAPVTKEKVEIKQLKAAPKRYIWLERTGDRRNPKYFAINNYNGPVEIEASFKKKQNVYSTPTLPKRFTVEPGHSKTLFQIAGLNKYQSWQYTLRYRYTIGNPIAVHDNSVGYLPPFARNAQFRISQAFGGQFSHTDKQNHYAVDIVMPVDTAIHAARSGKVMEVNNDYFKSGIKKTYKSRANSIRILHDDGSMAIYAHLALEKAQVYPGLRIAAGQLIGYSGNTGYSTGPHLHFAIQLNKGMKLVSVPFNFMDNEGAVKRPVAGTWLIN